LAPKRLARRVRFLNEVGSEGGYSDWAVSPKGKARRAGNEGNSSLTAES